MWYASPTNICLFKVKNGNKRKRSERCSKLTIDVVLLLLLLGLNVFHTFSTLSVVDFKLVNICWEVFLQKRVILLFIFLIAFKAKVLAEHVLMQKATYRSSHRRCSVRKGVLREFAKFIGKQLCQGLFLKEDSSTGVFLWIFQKNTFFTEHL